MASGTPSSVTRLANKNPSGWTHVGIRDDVEPFFTNVYVVVACLKTIAKDTTLSPDEEVLIIACVSGSDGAFELTPLLWDGEDYLTRKRSIWSIYAHGHLEEIPNIHNTDFVWRDEFVMRDEKNGRVVGGDPAKIQAALDAAHQQISN
ncbi:MAG: hypothetical protein M1821_006639 [Bathelium mastoideum]|nr:MAG: hypothetical protein M1821_006639 [Bathelium mastoideum]